MPSQKTHIATYLPFCNAMSMVAGRPTPSRRSIPLFRPLCTTEKPPQLCWFSSALQSLRTPTSAAGERMRVADEAVPRRSLSTRWLEARGTSDAAGTLDRKGRPYGDDEMVEERRVPETMSVVTEEPEPEEMPVRLLASRRLCEQDTVTRSDFLRNAVLDSSESEPEEEEQEDPLAAYGVHRLGLYEPGTASDGNPVRHSLLNLVAEEDIPALLEAMAEECHFVFDDEPAPTTSGIIHAPAKRAERRRQRRVDRIRFEEKPPGVFAYLDETAAMQEEEWSEGFPISYEQYQRLIDDSQHPSTHDQWRVPVDTSDTGEPEPVVSETPEASSFPFGSARTFQPLQFRQIDAGSSAI